MSDFRVFEGGIEFLRRMKQMVKDLKEGRSTSFPYHIFLLAGRADARDVILFYRARAEEHGIDPKQVIGFRDPVSKVWIVLAPRELGDIFGIAWDDL